jgi:hypothetical protein
MNVVRFNEPFEHAIKAFPVPLPFTRWQSAPLFEYYNTRSKEKSMITQLLESGVRMEAADWPFETFRLSVSQTCDEVWIQNGHKCGEGQYRLDAIVTRQRERVYILGNIIRLYDETPATLAASRRYNPLIVALDDCYTSLDNPAEYSFRTNTFASGRWLNEKVSGALVQGVMDCVAAFIGDSMTPSNHIAEVRPDEPTRSVEWIRARTHYTLITHGHPANKKSVREGARVTVDTNAELRRMVHDRKGHYKQLRHPRYKYALNEKRYADKPKGTIYVKPCWVGPKEWRDQGGRQIYKILEPVSAAAAA